MSLRSREGLYRDALVRVGMLIAGQLEWPKTVFTPEDKLSYIGSIIGEASDEGTGDWCTDEDARVACLLGRTRRTPIQDPVRQYVVMRDGGTCGICGEEIVDNEDVHLDHVMPVSHGGTNDPENLQVSHKRCNLRKGARAA